MQLTSIPQKYSVQQLLDTQNNVSVYKGCYDGNSKKEPVVLRIEQIKIPIKCARPILEKAQELSQHLNHGNLCQIYQTMYHRGYLIQVLPDVRCHAEQLMNTIQSMGFTEEIIATIMFDVLNALNYLHQQNIIHNTIKLSNIIIDKSGSSLLGNYTEFILKSISDQFQPQVLLAIEQQNSQFASFKTDIYQFGLALYHLAHGQPATEQEPKISSKKNFSKQFKEIIEQCLNSNPQLRPTAVELLQSKFWQKKGEKQIIEEAIKEYSILQQIENVDVEQINQLLQGETEEIPEVQQNQFQFLELQKELMERQDMKIDQSNDVIILSEVSKLVTEIQLLKEENEKLQLENQRFRDRLKMFIQGQQK